MRLERLRLHNFRAFEGVELDFEDRATVLVGRNASGKTSVLDAIAVILGAWTSSFRSSREDRPLLQSDARLVHVRRGSISTVEPRYPVLVEGHLLHGESPSFEIMRALRHVDGRTTTDNAAITNVALRTEERLATAEDDLPLLAYYGAGRLWVHKRQSKLREPGRSRLDGYRAALESVSDTKGLLAWMRWREEDRLQRISRLERAGATERVDSPQLDAVSRAAASCLEGASRIEFDVGEQSLFVEFETGRMPFAALSDGQRNLVALAADLAWRATQLNPHLGADAPLNTEGIVLIDEIDLHLHPSWQRRVLEDLMQAFPRLQFIVTTHSPQVMANAPRDSLRLLGVSSEGLRIDKPRGFWGASSNTVLSDLLGVPPRPARAQEQLDELARAVDDGRESDARRLLDQLEELGLDRHDPSLESARWDLEHVADSGGSSDASDS